MMMGSGFIFSTVRLFRKKISEEIFFLAGPSARIIITARTNYDGRG